MPLDVVCLDIPDVKIIRPQKFGDHRGFFMETYNRKAYALAGITDDLVQDNHSLSAQIGTVRGLHFQSPPFAQGKLVRVVQGRILDIAVDLRKSSPSFGKWVSAEISADEANQIWIPAGFAHGFCTLEAHTQVIYKVSAYYTPQHDLGLLWNDPDLGIDWPIAADQATLSQKDRDLPRLRDMPSPFA